MDRADLETMVNMSYGYFIDRPVTPETIEAYVAMLRPAFSITSDEDALEVFKAVEAAHVVTMSDDMPSLDETGGHVDWLNPHTNQGIDRDLEWRFWEHYRQYLVKKKGWSSKVVGALDRLSSQVLSKLEDPTREGFWDRRGMVMGSVQSGKTANYTALITKAADAGYKFIVILAGVHNSLRSQTQFRINEEFLGYDIDQIQEMMDPGLVRIGVGTFSDHPVAYTLTTSNPNAGDFSRTMANKSGGIYPTPDSFPFILVIKKNVSILENLINWSTRIIGNLDSSGARRVFGVPLLVIDDECDYASVNTKKVETDEKGKVIEEWNPTTTNRRIRSLLHSFEKSAYVGYTATPYANIFIHMDHTHPKYGEDIFPRSFIVSLPQPTNYFGPDKVFGVDEEFAEDPESSIPLPVIRYVQDADEIIPGSHKPDLIVDHVPESLVDAIRSFILVCAARRIRSSGIAHNSMLIHVTRYTAVQSQIAEMVRNILVNMAATIQSGTQDILEFEGLWKEDFVPTSREFLAKNYPDAKTHEWGEIKKELFEAVRQIEIQLINGESGDVLKYREADLLYRQKVKSGQQVPWQERGVSVIAIGGDKLSRGLTLDGLSVSYYLRASRLYDTLMQMGRWFGFRHGYNDLCRIYTTPELAEWYRHIAGVNAELRNELEYMSAIERTPEEFRLKVRSHPGRLAVTSATKSRMAEKVELSYEGRISETIVFDPRNSRTNIEAVESMIRAIGRPCDEAVDPDRPRYHWRNIPADIVMTFLNIYRTQDDAKKVVDPKGIAAYIEKQQEHGELTSWDVVFVSNKDPIHHFMLAGLGEVGCVLRRPLSVDGTKISIRRLVSPADELVDLSDEELELARQKHLLIKGVDPGKLPSGPAIRMARPKERGLLLLYFPANNIPPNKYGLAGNEIVGFAASFPRSDTAKPIFYWASPVHPDEE